MTTANPPDLQLNAADLEQLTVKIERIALIIRGQLPYPSDALLIGYKAFLDSQDVLKARLEG